MFEIMLRNAINAHYKPYFNDDHWIINQARPNGLLEQEASEAQGLKQTDIYNQLTAIREFS